MKTISERLVPYRAFLAEEKASITGEIQRLETQNCFDDANMLKIRLNIFDVFETVASADEKQCDTWEAFCQRYVSRFESLTAPWNARLASAVRNSDTKTRFIEEIKLSTAKRIHEKFLFLKEADA